MRADYPSIAQLCQLAYTEECINEMILLQKIFVNKMMLLENMIQIHGSNIVLWNLLSHRSDVRQHDTVLKINQQKVLFV